MPAQKLEPFDSPSVERTDGRLVFQVEHTDQLAVMHERHTGYRLRRMLLQKGILREPPITRNVADHHGLEGASAILHDGGGDHVTHLERLVETDGNLFGFDSERGS